MYFGGYLAAKEKELQDVSENKSLGKWDILEMSQSASLDALNINRNSIGSNSVQRLKLDI